MIGVFDLFIKKVFDFDYMCGIVMGVISDIDYIVNICLILVYGKLDDEGKSKFISEVLKWVVY